MENKPHFVSVREHKAARNLNVANFENIMILLKVTKLIKN